MAADSARQLWHRLGSEALPAAALCVEECKRLSDKRAERFWANVVDHLRTLTDGEEAPPAKSLVELAPVGRTWLVMQRIERYRHRAMQAERKAAESDAHCGLMLELAAQWLDLAKQAERRARAEVSFGDFQRSAKRLAAEG